MLNTIIFKITPLLIIKITPLLIKSLSFLSPSAFGMCTNIFYFTTFSIHKHHGKKKAIKLFFSSSSICQVNSIHSLSEIKDIYGYFDAFHFPTTEHVRKQRNKS